jgi:hypothetical protein
MGDLVGKAAKNKLVEFRQYVLTETKDIVHKI